MELVVRGVRSEEVDRIRRGGADANGQAALTRMAEGQKKLVVEYRPFDALHPYSGTGPIFLREFLRERPCERFESDSLPAWLAFMDPAIIRGYGSDDWIRNDTGNVVPGPTLAAACRQILGDDTVAYVHIRSKFNGFQCRVARA